MYNYRTSGEVQLVKTDRRVKQLLDILARGDFLRQGLVVVFRGLALILGFGALYFMLRLLGEAIDLMRVDAALSMGALLALALMAAGVYLAIQILLIRAERLQEGSEQRYVVIAAAIPVLKLSGELHALALTTMALMGCVMIWFGSHFGLPTVVTWFMRHLPIYAVPPFVGGLLILVSGAIQAVGMLAIYYFLAEAVQMLRNYALSKNIR